jgi:hypothetical protein
MNVRVRLVALAVALCVAGCRRPQGPADQYRAFAAAARAGDADAVWGMLSDRSRALLDARARDVAARAPGGIVPASGRELVLSDTGVPAPRVRSAVAVRESRDAAVVAVELEGVPGTQNVSLVRERSAWRVVLPGAAGP